MACMIEGDKDLYFIKIDIMNGDRALSTVEFADITEDVNDLIELNEHFNVYQDVEELKKDLAQGCLDRALGEEPLNNEDLKIGLLLSMKAKLDHTDGVCGEDCHLCNPNLRGSIFPDFTFLAKFMKPEGSS